MSEKFKTKHNLEQCEHICELCLNEEAAADKIKIDMNTVHLIDEEIGCSYQEVDK